MKYCPHDGKKFKEETIAENSVYRIIIYRCSCGCKIKRVTNWEQDRYQLDYPIKELLPGPTTKETF